MSQADTNNGAACSHLVWFITGTSSGLGRALVQAIVARGDYVVATARNVDSIREFAEDPETAKRVLLRSLDVRAPFEQIRFLAGEVIEKFRRIDVLINNAGVGMPGISEEVGVEGYKAQLDNNFFGPLNVTNAFLPYMRTQRKGSIVFVGSRTSWRANVPMFGAYAASKAALTAMAEALSVEVAPLGIKVLNVLPGGMRTETWNKMYLLPTSPDSLLPPLVNPHAVPETRDQPIGSMEKKISSSKCKADKDGGIEDEKHIADYADMRRRQIEWMRSIICDGDARKCAHAIIDIGAGKLNWPELNLLVLGADAEANIRNKCIAVLRNLEDWKEVVRGIGIDHDQM